MFINLYESLLKGKPVYTLIFIHICEAMLTALTGQVSGRMILLKIKMPDQLGKGILSYFSFAISFLLGASGGCSNHLFCTIRLNHFLVSIRFCRMVLS
jgi:hypothetical protein